MTCKPEFSVNSSSEPFTIVYGLLNASDSMHYIKIFKSFLVEGNAYDVVRDIDKYSYIDSIEVSVNEYDSHNQLLRTIPFDTTTSVPKDVGVFAYPTQIVYKSPSKLKTECLYELVILNKYTNSVVKTKMPFALAGTIDLKNPNPNGITISFTDQEVKFVFFTAENATMYQFVLYYYYTETLVDNTSRQPQPVVWNLGTVHDENSSAGKEKSLAIQSGADFFRKVGEQIKVDDRVKSRHTDSLVLYVYSAAKDWGLYLQANIPTSGINQERLHYSNVLAYDLATKKDKYTMGIFSSRGTTRKMFQDLTEASKSRDSLFHGRYTGHLKFTDIY
jgi:hypothetical protein